LDAARHGMKALPDRVFDFFRIGYPVVHKLRRRFQMRRIQEVDVVASHAKDILIGTRLLDRNRLIVDFRKNLVLVS